MLSPRGATWVGTIALIAAGVAVPEAWADRILLRGGDELRGIVLPDPGSPGKVLVQTEKGTTPVAFAAAQIARVIRVPGPLDEYFARRENVEPTAEAEYGLGLWCEEAGLTGLAEIHYRRAVEWDKSYAPAHKKLGHVLHEGRWLSVDEVRVAQGLVKHKGRWITPEEKARLDAGAAFTADQASWIRRIKTYRRALDSEKPEARHRARQDLMEIREPAAVAPLVQFLAGDGPLLDQILGAIPGPEALNALVNRILIEVEPEVRLGALEELTRRDDAGEAAPLMVRMLKHRDMAVVGRAAWALAGLNEVSAVPKLIGVLVRVQQQVVMVPTDGGQAGGGPNMGFTSVGPGFNAGGLSYPVYTSAAVGPGVIGIGAGTPPLFNGLSIAGPPRPPQPQLVRYVQRNDAVLEALVRLTGVDFGFDIPAWRAWLASTHRSETVPTRRVPEP